MALTVNDETLEKLFDALGCEREDFGEHVLSDDDKLRAFLDDFVYEYKSIEASYINNQGLQAQIDYLTEEYK